MGGGKLTYAERDPVLNAEAKRLRATGMKFQAISDEFARRGWFNKAGRPFAPTTIWSMVRSEVPVTTIYDVAEGDFVGLAQDDAGRAAGMFSGSELAAPATMWVKIAVVEAVIDQVNPLHYRSWHVVTTTGIRLSMFDIAAYRTKEQVREICSG